MDMRGRNRSLAMIRWPFLLATIAAAAASTAHADWPKRGSFPCYWTYGRLSTANGGPPNYRIWPKGTNRLLGVYGRNKKGDFEPDILPTAIKRLNPSFHVDIWGNYKICPIVEERKGWMRMVEIKQARNLNAVTR